MKDQKQYLRIAIRNGLAASTRPLNSKLKSEDALVEALGVSRRYLREIFCELTLSGHLRRRRPCGTFLVQRPEPIPDAETPDELPPHMRMISSELLFDSAPTGGAGIPAVGTLTLQFWGLSSDFGTTHQLIQAGMLQEAEARQVTLSFHPLELLPDMPLPQEEIAQQLRHSPADAFLVPSDWRGFFLECLGNDPRPVVYLDCGSLLHEGEIVVASDSLRALELATELFLAQGMRHLAIVALDEQRQIAPGYLVRLEHACRGILSGKPLCSLRFLSMQLNPKAIADAACRLFDGNRPDAVFINDDYLLPILVNEWKRRNLVPGRDLGVITLSNQGVPLPGAYHWSSMNFNPGELGRRCVVEAILRARKEVAGPVRVLQTPVWLPGDTHTGAK